MSLHPQLRSYLEDLAPLVAQAQRDGVRPTPESARAALAALTQYSEPARDVAHVFDALVPATASIPAVPVRVYVPRPEEASDVVVFVHGGGHMAGDLDVYDGSARRVAQATGMVVVSVDYRRSPEHPYPAGLTDVHHALERLDDVLSGVRTAGRVGAFADSGGGAKLASVAQRVAAGTWSSPIGRQVLLYPSLDYTMGGASITELGTGYLLTAERIAWYFEHYFDEDDDRAAASPLLGPYDDAMPETLVIVAEYDPLRSEAEEYVERMRAAGSSAWLLVAPGMIHAFAFFETLVGDDVERLYAVAAEFLRDGSVPERW